MWAPWDAGKQNIVFRATTFPIDFQALRPVIALTLAIVASGAYQAHGQTRVEAEAQIRGAYQDRQICINEIKKIIAEIDQKARRTREFASFNIMAGTRNASYQQIVNASRAVGENKACEWVIAHKIAELPPEQAVLAPSGGNRGVPWSDPAAEYSQKHFLPSPNSPLLQQPPGE